MSDPKLISPLLDHFIMGDPISDHNGMRCCPAMNQDTNDKYIVKIISLPPSRTQIDALMLTGAFQTEEDARAYYKSRAEELVAGIEVLQKLSKQEGFLPFEGYQIVPMEDQIGFDVYVLTSYRRSLERQMVKKPLSHLDALNLGLDICSALTACRRGGYLYTNLKPSNIFLSGNGEYKISDYGFTPLNGLQYATIAENHISDYTPPEIEDAFSSLNTTMDVYALGMILYTIYNGGILPNKAEKLAAPQYADEELSAIILKACDLSVEERWQEPAAMGQALVTYMQKNGASNDPIIPPVLEETQDEANEEINQEVVENVSDISEEILQDAEILLAEEAVQQEEQPEPIDETVQSSEETAQSPANTENTLSNHADAEESIPELTDTETDDVRIEPATDPIAVTEKIDQETFDSVTVPAENDYADVSDDISEILSQVDRLASMKVPNPVVSPDPVEITLPTAEEMPEGSSDTGDLEDLRVSLEETETNNESAEEVDILQNDDIPVETQTDEEADDEDDVASSSFRWVRILLIILAVSIIAVCSFLFYHFYVLQNIDDLRVLGTKDQLSVYIQTKTDEEKLSISCTDIYGHEVTVPVVNGEAHFSGLQPNSEYSVSVKIAGLHILKGKTYKNYFTPSVTSIVQYSIVTGNTNDSVILNFTVEGPDSENWIFTYSAPGVEEQSVTFPGHTLTLNDLLDKQTYVGTLRPEDDIFMESVQQISFTASEVIQAKDLMITSCKDGKLVAKWTAPETVTVDSWTVHCYNETGYDKTITVTDTVAEFTGLDSASAYYVDVTAAGQSVMQRDSVQENALTVENITADTSVAGVLTVSWESDTIPSEGWILEYTIKNSDIFGQIPCDYNQVTITPAVPEQEYRIVIKAADGTQILCDPCIVTTPEAKDFSVNYHGNHVTINNLHFSMCRRPSKSNWSYKDVSSYTSRFKVNQKAAFVIYLDRKYDVSREIITTAFVTCDEAGRIIRIDSSSSTWSAMWYKNYCELDIPSLPDTPGRYSMYIYFNGQFVEKQSFSVE